MVSTNTLEQDIRNKVGEGYSLFLRGINKYSVSTPFTFDDGDSLTIFLEKTGTGWQFTDDGHTFMHLTYVLDEKDIQKGTRREIINNTLKYHGVIDAEGVLSIDVPEERFGDALADFSQAILHISDVNYLNREIVRSTFMEDFRQFIASKVPSDRTTFGWHDATRDPQGKYVVDCRINHMPKPVLIFAIPNDDKASIANITMLQFEKWGLNFQSLAIFENQESIQRNVLARLTDVVDKQFATLTGNSDRIIKYFDQVVV
jgi:hypothetical protein